MTPSELLAQLTKPAVLDLGTIAVHDSVSDLDLLIIGSMIARHRQGDWGSVNEHDAAANNEALRTGERLLSAYDTDGTPVWVITEADRSVTTVLLPSAY